MKLVIASDGAARAWSIPTAQVEWLGARALFPENLRRCERGAPLLNVVDRREGD